MPLSRAGLSPFAYAAPCYDVVCCQHNTQAASDLGGSLFYGVGAGNPDLGAAEAAGLDAAWFKAIKCPVVVLYAKVRAHAHV